MSDVPSLSDLALLNAWVDGDHEASAALIGRHYQGVLLFFFAKVGAEIAQDLTQATFETLCAKKVSFRGDATVRTFLFGIARWKLVHHYRQSRGEAVTFDPSQDSLELPESVRSMESLLGERTEQILFVQGLRSLALDDQIMLELKYCDEMRIRELAAIYDVPRATMADRVARARTRLALAVSKLAETAGVAGSSWDDLDARMRETRVQLAAAVIEQ